MKTLHGFVTREAAACGRTKQKPLLTPGEMKWMERSDSKGLIDPRLPTGFIRAEFSRAMDSLQTKGYVTPASHTGYWQTEAGISAMKTMGKP